MNAICYYTKTIKGYQWFIDPDHSNNPNSCIMAIALNKEVYASDLNSLVHDGNISSEELESISAFDNTFGTNKDFRIIKQIAKRYNVKLKYHKKILNEL